MKKYLNIVPVLLALYTLTGCGNTHQPAQKETVKDSISSPGEEKSRTFSEYSSKISQVKLPFHTDCNHDLDATDTGMPDSLVQKFAPENGRIYGKLAENEKYTAILYLLPADIILPVIVTTDPSGKKISELPLFEKYCGDDEFSSGTAWADISKDLHIELVDSVQLFKRDKKGEIRKSTIKTEVRRRTFYISNNGNILSSDKEAAL